MNKPVTINSKDFYGNYYGHTISHLKTLLYCLKKLNSQKNFIYLCGDSSLDNKHWLENDMREATNDYQYILNPPVMKQDIAYHMNNMLNYSNYRVINCAIEESTLAERANKLFEQDEFIKHNITNNDILIVSVGGNDIALKPSFNTMLNMALELGHSHHLLNDVELQLITITKLLILY